MTNASVGNLGINADGSIALKTILLAHIQNAVPAFDHGARIANKAVARLIVRPAAVAGIGITGGAEQAHARADPTPRAARVVSPHGIPRKTTTTKDRVRSVEIGPDHNPRIRLGLIDRQGYAALRGPAEG